MILPPLLSDNDNVIIISPSGRLPMRGVEKAIDTLKSWKLNVKIAENTFLRKGVFAGADMQRKQNFQQALDDETVQLILCARGGYGLTRYIDELSLAKLKVNPKWVVGFSDITAFHMAALSKGILSIHGPMGTSFSRNGSENSLEALHQLLFKGKSTIVTKVRQLNVGHAKGKLVGGNLALICDSLGTVYEIDTGNKILVLEDVGEYYYRIDRMLNHLARAGKFNNIVGLVIGSFSDIIEGEIAFEESVIGMIKRLTSNRYFPVAIDMPIGHEPNNYPFVQGAEYSLEVQKNGAKLSLTTKL